MAAFESLARALIGIALEGLEVAGAQVSLPQFRLLLTLGGLGRVPSSKLAAQLRLAPSAVTRMVDRHRHELLGAVLDRMTPADHAAAVRAARQFADLSGDAIAVGESGPVPL